MLVTDGELHLPNKFMLPGSNPEGVSGVFGIQQIAYLLTRTKYLDGTVQSVQGGRPHPLPPAKGRNFIRVMSASMNLKIPPLAD